MADFGVDVTLALFGGFVFGVFGKIPVGAGHRDLLGEFDVELVRKRVDFFLQLLLDLGDRVGHGSWLSVR